MLLINNRTISIVYDVQQSHATGTGSPIVNANNKFSFCGLTSDVPTRFKKLWCPSPHKHVKIIQNFLEIK